MLANPPIEAGTKNDEVKENVTTLWTNFAKTGNPSPDWPVAEAEKGFPYVEITEKIVPKENFYGEEVKFWDEIYDLLRSWTTKVLLYANKQCFSTDNNIIHF